MGADWLYLSVSQKVARGQLIARYDGIICICVSRAHEFSTTGPTIRTISLSLVVKTITFVWLCTVIALGTFQDGA